MSGQISAGGTLAGSIVQGQTNSVTVSLTAGFSAEFDVFSQATASFTPQVELLSSTGAVVVSEQVSANGDARLTVTPSASGTDTLSISSYYSNGAGAYSLVESPQDDFSNNAATTGTVTSGGTTAGNLASVGDSDWFGVTLAAGFSYEFDVISAATGALTPQVELLTPLGAVAVGEQVSGNGDARLIYTPTVGGTYDLAVSSYYATGTGAYQITATPPDDYTNTATTTGSIAIGGTTTGVLGAIGDQDWIAVTLTAGLSYRFDLLNQATSSLTPQIEMLSAAGAVVKSPVVSSGGDAQLTYTAAASGTYYLAVSSYYSTGTGSYQLVSAPVGSFTGDVTTSISGAITYYNAGTQNDGVTTVGGQSGVVFLGSGADTVASLGNDTIVGGAGAASVSASANTVTFGKGPMSFVNGAGNATVVAAGALTVAGGTGSVVVFAGSGDTLVNGGAAGNNVMEAGSGNATLIGGGNNDVFVGGAAAQAAIVASQTAVVYGGSGSDTVQGGSGQLYAIGGSGQMIVTMGSSNQTNLVYGGSGGMTINETAGPDYVIGGKGSIVLNQTSGQDTVFAGSGSIQIHTGTGFDAIEVYAGQAGGSVTTDDFRIGGDHLILGGFASGAQQAALSGASFSSAGALLTLTDGTHITLGGLTQATLSSAIFN